jgi:hypothetical protein
MAKVTIRVLRPFVFTPTPRPGVRGQPDEIRFGVGPKGEPMDHQIEESMFEHPWLSKDYADGKIENPAQAVVRAKAEAIRAEETAREAEAARVRSEAAIARAASAHSSTQALTDADTASRETPVGELSRGGAGGPGAVAGGADADVPVNILQERQKQARAAK